MARLRGSLDRMSALRNAVRCAVPIFIVFSLGACSGMPSFGGAGDGADIPEDRLEVLRSDALAPPTLRPGDRFTYDNPEMTWQVIAQVAEDRLAWQASDGSTQITAADPLMPALEWNTPSAGAGRRLISDRTEPLFPLEVGKKVRFRSTVDSDAPPYAWEYDWTCEVLPIEEVTVPAGSFFTYPVRCGRGTGDDATFFYSPVVGNYVRISIDDPGGGPKTVRNLISFSRSDGALRLADAEMAPEVGQVRMEDSDEGAPILSAGTDSAQGEQSGRAPMALGMLSGVEPAPAQAPQSELVGRGESDGTTQGTIGDTAQFDPNDSTMTQSTMSDSAMSESTMTGTNSAQAGLGGVVDGRTIAVHLASYLNPDNAESGWDQLLSGHRDQLDGTRPMIRQVDLGDRGIFFRLHAGPITGEAQAEEICRVLTSRGVYCQVTRL